MLQPHERLTKGQNVLIALGSNATSHAGGAQDTIREALAALEAVFGAGLRASSLYATPCFPAGAGPDYVNAACCVVSNMPAQVILQALHEIETAFGRVREGRWEQRTLDLDLLAVGAEVLPDIQGYLEWKELPVSKQKTQAPEGLILPHPRMQDRSFVLVPLADVAPEWSHPVLCKTVKEMLADRPAQERAEVVAI